jgi:GT2 family glycosyltransferase
MFVIITDFNGFSRTQRCLEGLRASCFRDYTIVVVDHGTSDDTRENLAERFPEVVRLSASSELWWTGATNLGIRYALNQGAEAIMLMNNDCYVTPETMGELVAQWATHQDAIIAPVQRDWRSGAITTITPRSLFLFGFPSMTGPRKMTPAMLTRQLLPTRIIAGGRGVLIHASIFRAIGLFDEKHLPHYWADHDFYLRAHRQNVPLFIATRAFVDIDNSSTTMADNPGRLTLQQWTNSLNNIRSHRNLVHVTELFKRHYPFKHMYMVGVMLYTGRYLMMYLLKRVIFLYLQYLRKNETLS